MCVYMMLLEVRKLIFSDDLFRQALLAHCAREKVTIPNSQIQEVRILNPPDSPTSVLIEFVAADPNKPFEVQLDEQFVLAAMILACKVYGVPLPRDATKALQHTEQGPAMTVSMKIGTPILAPLAKTN